MGRIRACAWEPRRVMPLMVTGLVRLFNFWGAWRILAGGLGIEWEVEMEIEAASIISGTRIPRR